MAEISQHSDNQSQNLWLIFSWQQPTMSLPGLWLCF